MLYKLYKKQVEAWKERLESLAGLDGYFDNEGEFVSGKDKARQHLVSSRHKDTIELLEAEIERKKGMKWKFVSGRGEEADCAVEIKSGAYRHIGENAKDITEGRNSAIEEDIAYLEEQVKLIQKEQ